LNTFTILTLVPETFLLMQSLVSILEVVIYQLCSLDSMNKVRLVDLCCWRTSQETRNREKVFVISLFRFTVTKQAVIFT
jgi:hypothetical protein